MTENFQTGGFSDDSATIIADNGTQGAEGNVRPSAFVDRFRTVPNQLGEFQILRELGRGGMGVVYEAFQPSLQRRVALKVLPIDHKTDPRQVQRFRNESAAAAQLSHPNIVPVYAVGQIENAYFYAMQFIAGDDLATVLRNARKAVDSRNNGLSGETPELLGTTIPGGAPPHSLPASGSSSASASFPTDDFIRMFSSGRSYAGPRLALKAVAQLGVSAARALQHAHECGVIHRDIKPANLMLGTDGALRVTDFGLARIHGALEVTMTGEVLGTYRYMSPEQAMAQRISVDERTDIYSLGITLYELFTLRRAFNGETPQEILRQVTFEDPIPLRKCNPHVTEDLEIIVNRAIAKNPEDRYQSASEMADDLQRYVDGRPVQARRPTLLQRARRWVRDHQTLVLTAACAGLLLLAVGGIAFLLTGQALRAEATSRRRTVAVLKHSEGLRLSTAAMMQVEKNPGLALSLGIRGARLHPSAEANGALLTALEHLHEERTAWLAEGTPTILSAAHSGPLVAVSGFSAGEGGSSSPTILWDRSSGDVRFRLDDNSNHRTAVFSPDDRWVLTLSSDDSQTHSATAVLWNAETGEQIQEFPNCSAQRISESCFSPNGNLVLIPTTDRKITCYAPENRAIRFALEEPQAPAIQACYSSDGRFLFSLSADGIARCRSAEDNRQISETQPSNGPLKTPLLLPALKGTICLITSSAGTVRINAETGTVTNEEHWPQSAAVLNSRENMVALFDPFGQSIVLRDLMSQRRISEFSVPTPVRAVQFLPDSRHLLVIGETTATIHQVDEGRITARFLGHEGSLRAGTIAAAGQIVLTSGVDGSLRSWHLQSGSERLKISSDVATTLPIPYSTSADSSHMAWATKPRPVTQVMTADGSPLHTLPAGEPAQNRFVDGRLLTITSDRVMIWDTRSATRRNELSLAPAYVSEAAVVPNTPLVLIVDDSKVTLWNSETSETTIFESNGATPLCHRVSGTQAAIGFANGSCFVIDCLSGNTVARYQHPTRVLDVDLSADAKQLLTVDDNKTLRLWQQTSADPIRTINDPESPIDRVRFAHGDQQLLGWCRKTKASMRCWSCATGELLLTSKSASQFRLELIPGSDTVILYDEHTGARLWNLQSGEETPFTDRPVTGLAYLNNTAYWLESTPAPMPAADNAVSETSGSVLKRMNLDARTPETMAQFPELRSKVSVDESGTTLATATQHFGFAVGSLKNSDAQVNAGDHTDAITGLSFVPGTDTILTSSLDGTASVWSATGRKLATFIKSSTAIVQTAVSPDGHHVASYDAAGHGWLWDPSTGKERSALPTLASRIQMLHFSPDSGWLAIVSRDSQVQVLQTHKPEAKTLKLDAAVRSADFTGDSRKLLVVHERSPEKTASTDALATLVTLSNLERQDVKVSSPVHTALCRPTTDLIYVIGTSGQCEILKAATGAPTGKFQLPNARLRRVRFSDNGKYLYIESALEFFVLSSESGIELFRRNVPDFTLEERQLLPNRQIPWQPFSADGQWLITDVNGLQKWPVNPLALAEQWIPGPLTNSQINRFSVDLSESVRLPERD